MSLGYFSIASRAAVPGLNRSDHQVASATAMAESGDSSTARDFASRLKVVENKLNYRFTRGSNGYNALENHGLGSKDKPSAFTRTGRDNRQLVGVGNDILRMSANGRMDITNVGQLPIKVYLIWAYVRSLHSHFCQILAMRYLAKRSRRPSSLRASQTGAIRMATRYI